MLLCILYGLSDEKAFGYSDADTGSMAKDEAADVKSLNAKSNVLRDFDDVAEKSEEVWSCNKHGGVCGAPGTSA